MLEKPISATPPCDGSGLMTPLIYSLSPQAAGSGNFLLGSFVFSTDASITELYACAGFDFVIIDMEHGLNDIASTVAHLRAARGAGIHALVRPGAANLADLPRLLDAGCPGVMIPHFGLGDEATRQAIRSVRYWPEGARPTCTGVSAAGFGIADFSAYVRRANAETLTIGLVEDRECIEHLDDVMEKRQVNWIMPGPGDLATAYGVPGQLRHPAVENAVDRVFEAGERIGTPIGMYVNDPKEIPRWYQKGARFFVLSIDFKLLAKTLKETGSLCRSAVHAA